MKRSGGWVLLAVVGLVGSTATSAQIPGAGAPGASDRGDASTGGPADLVNARAAATNAENVLRERQQRLKNTINRRLSKAVSAVAEDLKIGATVFDLAGVELGTIDAVEPNGVRLSIDHGHATVPTDTISKYGRELLLKTLKADFTAKVAAAAK